METTTEVLPAGPDQQFVVYRSPDSGEGADPGGFVADVAADAAARAADGWRIVSASVLPLRQMGTAGNILFQSGGQYATELTAVVVYGRNGSG